MVRSPDSPFLRRYPHSAPPMSIASIATRAPAAPTIPAPRCAHSAPSLSRMGLWGGERGLRSPTSPDVRPAPCNPIRIAAGFERREPQVRGTLRRSGVAWESARAQRVAPFVGIGSRVVDQSAPSAAAVICSDRSNGRPLWGALARGRVRPIVLAWPLVRRIGPSRTIGVSLCVNSQAPRRFPLFRPAIPLASCQRV